MSLPDTIVKTATHWRRGAKDYGWPDPVVLVVEIWWPLSDPEPSSELWPE